MSKRYNLENVHESIPKYAVAFLALKGHSGIDLTYIWEAEDQLSNLEEALELVYDSDSYDEAGSVVAVYKLIGYAKGKITAEYTEVE